MGTSEKTRVLALIKSDLAIKSNARLRRDIMTLPVQTVWLDLSWPKGRCLMIGGVYRQWTSLASTLYQSGLSMETEQLDIIVDQVKSASESSRAVIVLGDMNLDAHRSNDSSYSRRPLLNKLVEGMEDAGLDYIPTPHTWRSYGKFGDSHRVSCLDHVYCSGIEVNVKVLEDSSSDHRPVLVRVDGPSRETLTTNIVRRNYKAVKQNELDAALQLWPWEDIHAIKEVNAVNRFIVDGITFALDWAAPAKSITVRKGNNLFLSSDTLDLMECRDRATGKEYRFLRNRVSSMVRRDRMRTNLEKLHKANDDPKVLWQLANSALGKPQSSLPASLDVNGTATVGDAEAAAAMNNFYIDKIKKLRENLRPVPSPPSDWPKSSLPFSFSFASAGKISRVIKSLTNTEALGLDNIPVSILKKGVDVLASPIAHLVNISLSTGIVPDDFKIGRVIPIHKGKGKNTADPASYRPVSILPALSKILEVVVKADLESHLNKLDALPNSQFGFRTERSSTAALATAHAQWIRGKQEGKVVGILGFDLSSAFDTVDQEQLIPKLKALGITGIALDWFKSYMSGGKQCVDWNGTLSSFANVMHGVRQGSILGPILYLILVADMPDCIGIGEDDNSAYADDTFVWAIADDVATVESLLNERAEAFACFAAGNGLVLNATKTQLMIGGNVKPKDIASFCVCVNGVKVKPSKEIEFLGVAFDSKFTTSPQTEKMVKAARQRASMVKRLTHHLPRGEYLRQLAKGLLIGKVSYAIAAVIPPRLGSYDAQPSAALKSIQVSINDVARSITGKTRTDHVRVPDLLHNAGLPSLNEIVVRAVAMETWKANHSSDGGNGGRNPIGKIIFSSSPIVENERLTRSKTAGIVPNPLRGTDTFAVHAVNMWNMSSDLRMAPTKHAAAAIAENLAKAAPI